MEGKAEVKIVGKVQVAGEISEIEIFPEFCDGLKGIKAFSHLIVLYWFHHRDNEEQRQTLLVVPKRHPNAPEVGVFACRSPSRPNPIGLCVVQLLQVENCTLKVQGLDAWEGSPIIDIKPYLPRADSVQDAITPEWMKKGPRT
jgi:tRNA-Thr(GGU) m(6)t(6)A37 methyltransferase TsaA